MRLLSKCRDHDRESLSGQKSQSDRCAAPASAIERSLPLLHACAHVSSHPARRKGDGAVSARNKKDVAVKTPGASGLCMNKDAREAFERAGLSRRGFLRTSGALTVGFCLLGVEETHTAFGQFATG